MTTVTNITNEMLDALWAGADAATIGAMSTEATEAPATATEVASPTETPATETQGDELPLTSDKELSSQLDKILRGGEDEEEEEQEVPKFKEENKAVEEAPKKGRKPADVVNVVKSLIDEGILLGMDEGEIKTVDEAKEIIKLNLEKRDEDADQVAWQRGVSKFSPQGQAIIKYMEDGATSATELMDLLGAIRDIEDVNELDISNTDGQKEIIKRAYIAKGFKEALAEKQANRYADLGPEALEEHAKELFPELKEEATNVAAARLREREELRVKQQEATRAYFDTVKGTLDKGQVGGIKLKREDQQMLIQATADYTKHVSFNGKPTSAFVKKLEDLQFGDKADYDLYLSIVFYAMDPKTFLERASQEMVNKSTSETARQIRLAKSTKANSQEDNTPTMTTGKNTLKKKGFVNPYG